MTDEHKKIHPKKKENIRVFIQRKRLSSRMVHRSLPNQFNNMDKLTSFIEKSSHKKKNIIIVNYKPIFHNTREEKPTVTPPNTRRPSLSKANPTPSKVNNSFNRQSNSINVPDVEDPFVFIETLYQQLFTDDGQLRSDAEPTVIANCVKQMVTQSRRNSIAVNMNHQKRSSASVSPLSRPTRYRFDETEEPNFLSQRNRTANTSRRSSKRSSMDHGDHHQLQLHSFLNSYYHSQKRRSTNPTLINNSTYGFSIDDTDNEDLDTFSDINSYRKLVHHSPPSIDEDISPNDSKLLLSSGYQSLQSPEHPLKNEQQSYCTNCFQSPQITIIPPTLSTINLIQPAQEVFMKCLNFVLISKNILLLPLFIFLLRQKRSIDTNN